METKFLLKPYHVQNLKMQFELVVTMELNNFELLEPIRIPIVRFQSRHLSTAAVLIDKLLCSLN